MAFMGRDAGRLETDELFGKPGEADDGPGEASPHRVTPGDLRAAVCSVGRAAIPHPTAESDTLPTGPRLIAGPFVEALGATGTSRSPYLQASSYQK